MRRIPNATEVTGLSELESALASAAGRLAVLYVTNAAIGQHWLADSDRRLDALAAAHAGRALFIAVDADKAENAAVRAKYRGGGDEESGERDVPDVYFIAPGAQPQRWCGWSEELEADVRRAVEGGGYAPRRLMAAWS